MEKGSITVSNRDNVDYVGETFHCWFPLHIRFRDLDPLAHVNNTVYFTYYEEARSYYLHQLTPWQEEWHTDDEHQQLEEQPVQHEPGHNPRIHTGSQRTRYGMLVKEITCTYHLPLIRSDQAEVGTRTVKVGRTSFIMEHLIRDPQDHSRVYATGRSVMVWCDYFTGRPHPVPPAMRYSFEQMEGHKFD